MAGGRNIGKPQERVRARLRTGRLSQRREFERLVLRLPREERRIVAALIRRLVELEAAGRTAEAMRLIDQLEALLRQSPAED